MKLLLALLALQSSPDVTFVRHGETLANSTGRYNARTIDTFSPKGEAEVQAFTHWMTRQPRFATIFVSPSPRALRTIAPYLRLSHRQAVVWPLLYECCTGRRPKDAHPTTFRYGSKIAIPPDEAGLFTVQAGHDRFPSSPDYDAGLAQVRAAVAEFRGHKLSGRVLLVGHSGMGGQFIHALTGHWVKLENAAPIQVK